MNAHQFAAVFIIGVFAATASAGEQRQPDPPTIATVASAQESAALQTIRWRVAASCYQNVDCAARAASGVDDRRLSPLQATPGEPPSTPERRRALGLVRDPANQ
jgi:hypothetical protein